MLFKGASWSGAASSKHVPLRRLAGVLIRQGQLTTARADLEETLAALQAQLGLRPGMKSLHDLLASGYSQLERVFRQIGEMARADEAARNAQTERDAARHSP